MAEIGRICLTIAFVVTAYLTVASALGAQRRQADLLASARNGVYVAAALTTTAWLVLLYAFATHDFSIRSVANYNNRSTDLAFSLSGVYAGEEGSLLLRAWGVMMVMLIVTLQFRTRYRALMPWVTTVIGFVATFCLSLVTLASDPFARSFPVPADGVGLNPLLQNSSMLVHPPALFIGQIGFTVPFAFAMAALITGRLGDEWIRATRGWALFAWGVLAVGNLLGARWAYVVLGWGGYWGWDPVENAAIMPLLTGTAFLHSVMMQRRRGMLKVWNLALIIATFLLTLFGTFLTRSNILASVHTFGETVTGPLFAVVMMLILAVSVGLIWVRLPLLRSESEANSVASRESSFMLNNLLFVGATFAVFSGTMLPVVIEAVRGVRVTMSASFFDQVVGPFLLAVVALMGLCPLLGWRRATMGNLAGGFRAPAVVALMVGAGGFFLGAREIWAVVALAACGFALGTIGSEFYRGVRAKSQQLGSNPLYSLGALVWSNRPRYGGYLVHLGIVVMAVGIVGSQGFKATEDVTLVPSQEESVGSYRLVYEGLSAVTEGSKDVVEAEIAVYSGSQFVGKMYPGKEYYQGFDNPNTEVAIRSTPLEDLYIVLNGWDDQRSVALSLQVIPMVSWVWAGGYLLVLGILIAFWPRAKEQPQEAARLAVERPVAEILRGADA